VLKEYSSTSLGVDINHDNFGRNRHQALELGGETDEVWSRIFDDE